MPILETVLEEQELSQGDILEGIQFYESSSTGEPIDVGLKYALVISRDCVLAHKPSISVSMINEFPLAEIMSNYTKNQDDVDHLFDETRTKLHGLRDGISPDGFYLGALPNSLDPQKRFVARLDQISTIQLPELQERRAWIKTHRVAKLSSQFLRALPLRLLWSFGRVGVDDISWLCVPDLELLINAGNVQSTNIGGQISKEQFALETRTNIGSAKKPEIDGRNVKLKKLIDQKAAIDLEIEKLIDAKNQLLQNL